MPLPLPGIVSFDNSLPLPNRAFFQRFAVTVSQNEAAHENKRPILPYTPAESVSHSRALLAFGRLALSRPNYLRFSCSLFWRARPGLSQLACTTRHCLWPNRRQHPTFSDAAAQRYG